MRYKVPTRRGGPVPHYLVAVDPGTARPGVSIWFVDIVTSTHGNARRVGNFGDGFGCTVATLDWSARLLAGRAPRVATWGSIPRPNNPAHAAAVTVALVEAVIATHAERQSTTAEHPIALVVEWPIKYATKTAAHADLEGLRDMIRALPWTPRAKPTPSTWKGNVPKEITHARTLAALNVHPSRPLGDRYPTGKGQWSWDELATLERHAVEDDPNARDAVALGAWALEIVGRGCAT